jgi:hypothetical protein
MRARRDFSPLVDVREFILVENCHPTRERDRNLFAIGMNKIRIIEISNTKLKRKAQSVSLRILASVAKKKCCSGALSWRSRRRKKQQSH